jgi:hypothetical protein
MTKIEELATNCERGADALTAEATQLTGDPERQARKLAAADTVRQYAAAIRAGRDVNADEAAMVAHAAQMSGILIDPRPQPATSFGDPGMDFAEKKATGAALVTAGVFVHVAEPGQVAFWAIKGYEPTS